MEITHAKGTLYPALQLSSFRVRRTAISICILANRRGNDDVCPLPVARERVLLLKSTFSCKNPLTHVALIFIQLMGSCSAKDLLFSELPPSPFSLNNNPMLRLHHRGRGRVFLFHA